MPTAPVNPNHPTGPITMFGLAIGLVALGAGLLAWLWWGQWRWAATGGLVLVVLVVLVTAGAVVDTGRGSIRPPAG
ncbi:MAG: hypothetical protein ACRDZY_02315 [Acidimicrobiales bacterium]